jgi:TRAP-type C4-dicarboxylate transport system substrate-binding protein
MKRTLILTLSAALSTALGATLLAAPATSDELAVVGSWSGLPLHRQFEAPFWNDVLSEVSQGSLSSALTTHDQMGIGGGDVFRMLGDGVFDVGMTVADYAVSDAPELEGLDVPLIATDAASARTMVDAARPMVADIYADTFNAHVLAIAPYPPQVVFCNADVASLADLEGKKIRASGRMTALFLEALGAEGITLGFGEVPGALQRGVVDCAITGAGSGYNAGWWEVSTHLLAIPLGGWDPVVTAINMDTWNGLSAEDQATLESAIKEQFEDPAWEVAQDGLAMDIACLTGTSECTLGDARDLTLVEASEEDVARARDILVTQVLPDWAERAGDDWAQRWNASVGEATGVSIPLN